MPISRHRAVAPALVAVLSAAAGAAATQLIIHALVREQIASVALTLMRGALAGEFD